MKSKLAYWVRVFNEHQELEGDNDLMLTTETAPTSPHFLYWLKVWGDDERGDLLTELQKIASDYQERP